MRKNVISREAASDFLCEGAKSSSAKIQMDNKSNFKNKFISLKHY